jgi:general control protein GCN4
MGVHSDVASSSSDFDGLRDVNFDGLPRLAHAALNVGWYPLSPQEDSSQKESPQEDIHQAHETEAPKPRRPLCDRPSIVAGVAAGRRDKPLPPIVVDDPNDIVAMKRAKNTLAARKSRQRKVMKLEELEAEVRKLTEERDYWKKLAQAHGAGG